MSVLIPPKNMYVLIFKNENVYLLRIFLYWKGIKGFPFYKGNLKFLRYCFY